MNPLRLLIYQMKYLYYNIYYRLLTLLKSLGQDSVVRYNSVLLMSIFVIINIVELAVIVSILINKIVFINLPAYILLPIGLTVIAVNSILVFRSNSYKEQEKSFLNESKSEKIRGALICASYILFTIIIFILLMLYLNSNPIVSQ